MMLAAFEWTTAASLATAAGTLVLAVATFSAVRSSNRSARIAEAALQEQRRPVLAPSRMGDPDQKLMFLGGHWVRTSGGQGAVEHVDGAVYLAISTRNVGSGIAVCQGWTVRFDAFGAATPHAPLEDFRLQSRDMYIPSGDIGMWQGALRHPDDPNRARVIEAIEQSQPITVELLYTDLIGRERTISRFGLVPTGDTWIASLNRHWFLDWDGPRPDSISQAAGEVVLHEVEAADIAHRTSDPVDVVDQAHVFNESEEDAVESRPGDRQKAQQ
jgi:hypothetical protein